MKSGATDYYTAVGNIDVTVPASRLQTMTKDAFEAEFVQSWAASLLPYHPEFSKLRFAENSLRSSFNFIDRYSTTYNGHRAGDHRSFLCHSQHRLPIKTLSLNTAL